MGVERSLRLVRGLAEPARAPLEKGFRPAQAPDHIAGFT
jgi:hypothetical protein